MLKAFSTPRARRTPGPRARSHPAWGAGRPSEARPAAPPTRAECDEAERLCGKYFGPYKLQRAAAGDGSGGDDGALASAAFERFDRGASPVDAVKDLKITPCVARELLAEWPDLGGGFVVSGVAAAKIQQLAWACDESEVKNGDDLVAVLEQIDKTACSSCERRTPRLCLRCYSTRPPRAQKLLAAAMAASGTRREELARTEIRKQVMERARQRLVDPHDDGTNGDASGP